MSAHARTSTLTRLGSGTLRRSVVPLVMLVLLAGVILLARSATGSVGYSAELAHANGLRAGDKVRVAGLDVGTVDSVSARGTTVHVDFSLDRDARLTRDTATSVKLASLLGERYLSLEPGSGSELDHGGTIDKSMSRDSYTIEEFTLDATPNIEALDLDTVEKAIDVLSTDLASAPRDVRAALDGMTALSTIVTDRDQQIGRLLSSTQQLTSTVLDQQDELDTLMTDAGTVMAMVRERQDVLDALLKDASTLAKGIKELAVSTQADLDSLLVDLDTVTTTLTEQKKDLDEVIRLAGPTMRVYTNGAGDGPWLGVNAPYFVLPDDFYCTVTPKGCS
ncbi:phospholipid/cholesterol/gamma-HCH transport system substrate-binding protein [Nocardioides daedukensis]|uniref:Phospholipid/cholesterol/gamma-HCH transport system substrate-binding protein n=1 Tax=Nocardioides daedukensis TaxID=634462 RepID=A0A7Y9S430_9ACTN|nr:phospholipid/cholesterol/gamma-HCH transport system substrate-binding protein [Nocardioides daedukensis]